MERMEESELVELVREHWEEDEDRDRRLQFDTDFPGGKDSSFDALL